MSQSGEETQEWVSVLDIPTKKIIEIPSAELAPGMIQAKVKGIEGLVWVAAEQLNSNVYQHPPFPEDVRDILREIQVALSEVYPLTLEQWEDGFRRDRNPEREIALWSHMATLFTQFTEGYGLTQEKKKAYFRLLIACMNSPRENVFQVADTNPLTHQEAEAVLAAFYGDQQ